MNTKRFLLKSLCYGTASLFFAPRLSFGNMIPTQSEERNIPIIMLHKITETPRRPEDISTDELFEVFIFLFENKYRPINVTDIINKPEEIHKLFEQGFKPFALTVDDADPSVLFSRNNIHTISNAIQMPNHLSFLEIYIRSSAQFKIEPKATFFISETIPGVYETRNLQRAAKSTNKYFGGFRSLPDIIDFLETYPGIELGYHTCEHIFMRDMSAQDTRDILAMQINAFKHLNVFDKIKPIFAYTYGAPPSLEGVQAIKDLGFIGAMLAFPGVNEARYDRIPMCKVDDNYKLLNDPFFIPRTNVGAYIYAPPNDKNILYRRINPVVDLKKDFSTKY